MVCACCETAECVTDEDCPDRCPTDWESTPKYDDEGNVIPGEVGGCCPPGFAFDPVTRLCGGSSSPSPATPGCCCDNVCGECPTVCVFQVTDDCGYVTWDWQTDIDAAECSNYDNATLHTGTDPISIPEYTYANVGDCGTELTQLAQELDPCTSMSPMSMLSRGLHGGPGTELTKIIAWMGLTPAPGCKCKKRARYMDKMGCDWCEQNVSQIVGWLQEEHTRT